MSRDVQQRRGGASARDAAEAPVRVRTRSEESKISAAMWARVVVLSVVVLGFVGGVFYASSKMRFVEDILPKISDPGTFWAFNVAVASFAVIPGAASATSIAAGVIYGTPLGVALVGTSCAVGAGVSFVIARHAARPIVEKLFIKDGSRFAALDQAVMRDGAQIVLLARLSPFSPYVAMSFLFGLTAVDFWPYIGASAVGILPASFVYVYMGDTGRRATGGGGTSNVEFAFYAFGLLMTILVTARVTRMARETLGAKGVPGLGAKSGGENSNGWCGGWCGGTGGEEEEDGEEDTAGLLEMAERGERDEDGSGSGSGSGRGPSRGSGSKSESSGSGRGGGGGVEMNAEAVASMRTEGGHSDDREDAAASGGSSGDVRGSQERERFFLVSDPSDAAVRATSPRPTNRGR